MILQELNEAAKPKAKKGLGLSLTKIKTFETCSYRYFLQYIQKEKVDKKDYDPVFFKKGQFAHKWMESKIGGLECKFDSSTLSDEDKESIKGNCAKVFDNDYIKSILPKGEAERGFSLNITSKEVDGFEATPRYSRSADFSGFIDFYAKVGNTLHLVDWKTGGKKGKDDDTFMQLFLYAKAQQKLDGGNKFVLSFYYVDHDKIVTRELTLDELNKKIESIMKKAYSIPTSKSKKSFPATPGWYCKFCPFGAVRSSDKKIPCEFTNK
jgi:hypothetical protein